MAIVCLVGILAVACEHVATKLPLQEVTTLPLVLCVIEVAAYQRD